VEIISEVNCRIEQKLSTKGFHSEPATTANPFGFIGVPIPLVSNKLQSICLTDISSYFDLNAHVGSQKSDFLTTFDSLCFVIILVIKQNPKEFKIHVESSPKACQFDKGSK
jgi:hypothetical protein